MTRNGTTGTEGTNTKTANMMQATEDRNATGTRNETDGTPTKTGTTGATNEEGK